MLKIPEKQHGIVNRVQNSIFAYQGWPTVCRDENGVLYVAASSFRTEHVCPFGKTAMYISWDNGKTWCPPIVINDTYLDDRDAGIVYMGNGRMLVTWFCHPAESYRSGRLRDAIEKRASDMDKPAVLGMLSTYPDIPEEYAQGGSFVRVSEDHGVTWSETVRIPISAPHGPCLCRDGSLVYLGRARYPEGFPDPEEKDAIAAYASTDGGYTWERRGLCEKPEGTTWTDFDEPHVIELPDGTLFGALRSSSENSPYGFTMYTTKSTDGGRTWSPYRWIDVIGAPPHLMLHSSGALILSYGRRMQPPYGARALVSYDYGETWQDEYVIDDRCTNHDLGYTSTVELDDGSLLSVYYQRYPGDAKCSILYTKWKL